MATSEENTAIVQSCYQAFGAGDIAGLYDRLDNAIEWHSQYVNGISLNGTYKGKEQVGELLTKLGSDVSIRAFSPTTFLANGYAVVVLGSEEATVNRTQKTYQNNWVHVWEIAGEKVGRITTYNTVEKVLEAFTE